MDIQYHSHTTSLLNTEECKTAKPVLCFPTETNKTEELIGFQIVIVTVVHVWVWVWRLMLNLHKLPARWFKERVAVAKLKKIILMRTKAKAANLVTCVWHSCAKLRSCVYGLSKAKVRSLIISHCLVSIILFISSTLVVQLLSLGMLHA